jgi:hypothetical protein
MQEESNVRVRSIIKHMIELAFIVRDQSHLSNTTAQKI